MLLPQELTDLQDLLPVNSFRQYGFLGKYHTASRGLFLSKNISIRRKERSVCYFSSLSFSIGFQAGIMAVPISMIRHLFNLRWKHCSQVDADSGWLPELGIALLTATLRRNLVSPMLAVSMAGPSGDAATITSAWGSRDSENPFDKNSIMDSRGGRKNQIGVHCSMLLHRKDQYGKKELYCRG